MSMNAFLSVSSWRGLSFSLSFAGLGKRFAMYVVYADMQTRYQGPYSFGLWITRVGLMTTIMTL